jgi:undecaprenyl diphosphate synthase
MNEYLDKIDPDKIPEHIAIIMDGNGRWAKKQGLIRTLGHKTGTRSVKKIVKIADQIGVKVLTLYAFSTENWKRPTLEVKALMGLLKSFLVSELPEMMENNICLKCIGHQSDLPADVKKILSDSISKTSENTGLILNLALSYGSRSEIIRAVHKLVSQHALGELALEEITEQALADRLYTSGLPDPDLIIRTGGESRLSNFLLWQASYSEIYITETLWPDFDKSHFIQAILDYQGRQRRFGKTGDQLLEQE